MKIFNYAFAIAVSLLSFSSATAAPPAGWPETFDHSLTDKDCPATTKNQPATGKCLAWSAADKRVLVRWPDNEGCKGTPTTTKLKAGTVIDRFGADTGNFFSPAGETFASRALPYVCPKLAYTTFRVEKDLDVRVCTAAPWFGQPGGATQYMTVPNAADLIKNGSLVRQVAPAGSADAVCANRSISAAAPSGIGGAAGAATKK